MAHVSADGLFERYFWTLYPPDVRRDFERMLATDANPSGNPSLARQPAEAAELFLANTRETLGWSLEFDDASIRRLGRALDRTTRDALIAASDDAIAADGTGIPTPLFNTVVHGALYVGEVAVRRHGGRWSLRRPLWESVIHLGPNEAVSHRPFRWLLQHLSDDEIDECSLAYRFHHHVELPTLDLAGWPKLVATPALPSLKHPAYADLVAYLQRHLTAVRDLGAAFPSPAEFTARAYASLGIVPVHGGRVVIVHGQRSADPAGAVDVVWIGSEGVLRIDTVPADATPPYFARLTGDDLEITVVWQGRPHTHRIGVRGHGR